MMPPRQFFDTQVRLADLAGAAAELDLDGFIAASEVVGSAQGLAAGFPPQAVTLAGDWRELARLLKPFRDRALANMEAYRRAAAELSAQTWEAPGDPPVVCECAPDLNPDCPLGDHREGHLVPAVWRAVDAGTQDFLFYLCEPCLESFARSTKAADVLLSRLDDDEEEDQL